MILPNFRPPYLTPIKIQASSDVTPDAVNWVNITHNFANDETTITEKQITGINQTITLQVSVANIAVPNIGFYYRVGNTSYWGGDVTSDWPTISAAASGGEGIIVSSGSIPFTFNVSNNQYVAFAFAGDDVLNTNTTVTVTNQTDSNTTLDTFDITVFGGL